MYDRRKREIHNLLEYFLDFSLTMNVTGLLYRIESISPEEMK